MSNYPQHLLTSAIAAEGDKTIPPATAQEAGQGRLSQAEGWTQINSTAKKEGGISPKREDMNGALFLLSQFLMWYQQGGVMDYSTSLNYEVGNEVYQSGVKYRCVKENGPAGKVVVPGSDTEYWIDLDSSVQYIEQALNETQQAQARDNIDAYSKDEIDTKVNQVVNTEIKNAIEVVESGYDSDDLTTHFWVKFSFGLIIQGGITHRAQQRQNVTFKCPFETDCYTGIANVYNMADGKRSVTIQTMSRTNMDMGSGEGGRDPQSYRKTWLAIGF